MTIAGMFLSQPPMATSPSKPSAPATVSSESAITSRDTSEYFIPSVPIEMPSETVMVPNATGLAAGGGHAGRRARRQPVEVHVARRHLAPGRADADLRPGEVLAREADGVQHRPPRRTRGAVEDLRRVGRAAGPGDGWT